MSKIKYPKVTITMTHKRSLAIARREVQLMAAVDMWKFIKVEFAHEPCLGTPANSEPARPFICLSIESEFDRLLGRPFLHTVSSSKTWRLIDGNERYYLEDSEFKDDIANTIKDFFVRGYFPEITRLVALPRVGFNA